MAGATVTITGTNLTAVTGVLLNATTVTFTVINATTLTFTVPTGAQSGNIVLVTASGSVVSGTPLTVLPGSAAATVNVGANDAGVLNYAYALEQLEAAFYTRVRSGTYYNNLAATSAERLILDDLYYHEIIHRDFFKAAITNAGVALIPVLTTDFSSIDFNSRTSVLGAAKAFEDLGVAAYNGVVQYIGSPGYLLLAGKIVSVEARHAAIIRDLISENTFVGNDVATLTTAGSSTVPTNNSPAGASLERALSPTEVVALANTYLAAGSKLDVSGIK